MRMSKVFSAAAFGAVLAFPVFAADQTVSGTVEKLDRRALPPNAVLEVQLLDVSLMDVAATQLALKRIAIQGQLPVDYALVYDDTLVQNGMSYVVQAKILSGRNPIYLSTNTHPALTNGAGNSVDVRVEPINTAPEKDIRSLQKGTWDVISFDGSILDLERLPHLTFGPDNTVSAFTGCNQMSGTFTQKDDEMTFGPGAMTQMACAEPSTTVERTFVEALNSVDSYEHTESRLLLRDATGQIVMHLVPSP
ncbi:MAG: YbaY family lipoprotein [Pseudoruegeria sp.]